MTSLEDFLAISENHILEDIDLCLQEIIEHNADRKCTNIILPQSSEK
jgi:hypothetical protein